MTTQDMGKWLYKRKIYNIVTCYAELTIPTIMKYQIVKEDGTVFKELSPHQAKNMIERGEFTKHQQYFIKHI